MSHLGGWWAQRVLQTAGKTIVSVVNGVLGTALIQGILLGLSFGLAGVPGAIVLGAVGLVMTLLPLGIVVLRLPAALWLIFDGHTGWAAFVMAWWNGLLVSSLDSILRPYLISRGVRMPMVLIFLGVLGGLLAFGIIGVFLGPVLLAVARKGLKMFGDISPDPADRLIAHLWHRRIGCFYQPSYLSLMLGCCIGIAFDTTRRLRQIYRTLRRGGLLDRSGHSLDQYRPSGFLQWLSKSGVSRFGREMTCRNWTTSYWPLDGIGRRLIQSVLAEAAQAVPRASFRRLPSW